MAPSPEAAARVAGHPWWDSRSWNPRAAHVLSLAVAALALVAVSPTQGLYFDDWNFVEDSMVNVWEPHVGHLSVVPQLLYLAIRNVFGIEHFLPWGFPIIAVHLGLAHLLWRLMRPAGEWLATLLAATFMVLGAGGENILWAFQVGFVGALTFSVAAIVMLDRPDVRRHHLILASALLALGIGSSSTALAVVPVAIVVGLRRAGLWRTLAVVAPPCAAYGVWYVLLGKGSGNAQGQVHGAQGLLFEAPRFALTLLTEGLGSVAPLATAGTVTAAVFWLWWVFALRGLRGPRGTAVALAGAALIFAALTGITRAGIGLYTATSSRYVYIVVALVLPAVAWSLASVGARMGRLMPRGRGVGIAAAIVALGVIALYNVALLGHWIVERANVADLTYDRIRAAAQLDAERPGAYADDAAIVPTWAPDLELADARWFVAEGWLKPTPVSETARLSVLVMIGVDVSPTTVRDEGCVPFGPGDAPFDSTAPVIDLDAPPDTSVTIALSSDGYMSDMRTLHLTEATRLAHDDGATLSVVSASNDLAICEVP